MTTIAPLTRRLLHAVLPVDCTGCHIPLTDDPVPFFCRLCWATIRPLAGPACPHCGRPFASDEALTCAPGHLCSACRLRPPHYTKAWALYPYTAPLQDAICLFKYHKKVALAKALGDLMATFVAYPAVDLVMPVPLHPARLKDREYNQSLLLADRLNRRLHRPLSYDNLVRLRETPPQTELSRAMRLINLRRAFSVRHEDEVAGQRILLVDDVMTTGTTVNECAKTLRKAGALEIYVVTLARTL